MKKKTRTLIILLAVLVVMTGAYIGVNAYTRAQLQKSLDNVKAAALWGTSRSAPVNISYTAGDKTLSFKLVNNTWTVADKKDFPLSQEPLTSLASVLMGLTAVRTLDLNSPLSVYGLDKPSHTLTASDDKGNALTLLIGAEISNNYYVMVKDGNKIYTISPTLVDDLKPDYLSFITLDTVHSLTASNMDAITLTGGKTSLKLDKHQNKDGTTTWFVVNGSKATSVDEFVLPVKSDKSAGKYQGDAVTALSSVAFSSCAAYKPAGDELKTLGLDVPRLTVKVDYTDVTGQGTLDQKATAGSVGLEIGVQLADGSGYYARLPGSDQVNVLPATSVTPLLDALAALASS